MPETTEARRLEKAAAELVLATLFLEPSPARLEALKNAALALRNWEGVIGVLESHGILVLARRNLELAGVMLPAIVGPLLEARHNALCDEAPCARLTLNEFLRAKQRTGLEVLVLGSAALALDLWPDPALRGPDAPEILVRPSELRPALRTAESAGLLPDVAAWPAWWLRLSSVSERLAPSAGSLRPLVLHWHLHHPSLLHTVELERVFARATRVEVQGIGVLALDPLDRLLDLCTRLASRAGEALAVPGRGALLRAAATSGHPLHLGWMADLRAEIERAHAQLDPRALLARAREWNAEEPLRATLECLQMGLGFPPGPREWVRQVALGLASPGGHTLPSFEFRSEVIERLPRWILPPHADLCRLHGLDANAGAPALRRAMIRQATRVLGRVALLGLAWPFALLARRLARSARRKRWERARRDPRRFELDASRHAVPRSELEKPRGLKSLSLEGEPTYAELRRRG